MVAENTGIAGIRSISGVPAHPQGRTPTERCYRHSVARMVHVGVCPTCAVPQAVASSTRPTQLNNNVPFILRVAVVSLVGSARRTESVDHRVVHLYKRILP